MADRSYSPDDQRAKRVHELFAVIARRYDLLNDVMSLGLHRRWKQRLVTLATESGNRLGAATKAPHGTEAAPTLSVLDLCCGTGDIARRLPGRVVGVDFTAEMLRIAATRTTRVHWVCADALQLPFPNASFDVVTIGYGLRNLANLDAGLREILRVLRPGGRLLSLDFGKPSHRLWRALYFAHLRSWAPLLGGLLAGNAAAYAYLLASLEAYPGQRGVQSAMERCGFVECGFEEFWSGAMAINWGRKPPRASDG